VFWAICCEKPTDKKIGACYTVGMRKIVNNTNLPDAEFQRAYRAYHKQRQDAQRRKDRNGNPIEWHFTFETWLDLWLKSGHWHQRGRGRGQYVMSRIGDVGPYAPWNVEIKLHSENASEGNKGITRPPISDETRKKMSEAKKGRPTGRKGISKPKMACVHCGKLCDATNLKRWHGDNCRHKPS
jgi:hypothetical protein